MDLNLPSTALLDLNLQSTEFLDLNLPSAELVLGFEPSVNCTGLPPEQGAFVTKMFLVMMQRSESWSLKVWWLWKYPKHFSSIRVGHVFGRVNKNRDICYNFIESFKCILCGYQCRCVFMSRCVCLYMCVCNVHTHAHMHAHNLSLSHTHIHTQTHIQTHVHTQRYVCLYICVCTHTHTHPHPTPHPPPVRTHTSVCLRVSFFRYFLKQLLCDFQVDPTIYVDHLGVRKLGVILGVGAAVGGRTA